jgi:hypothetical protein
MKSARRIKAWSVALAATWCVGGPAAAQTLPQGEQASNQAAGLQKFDEGRAALAAGDYASALASFDASNKLLASPNSLLYMARCYKSLGRIASASTTYRLASRQAQDRLVATNDKRYVATRDAAAREAAEIEASVPKLAIRLPSSVPAGLGVRVNGADAASSTWGTAVDTDPGHIVVEASGPRLRPFRAEIDLRPSETERVDVVLERVPTASLRLRFPIRPSGMSVRLGNESLGERESTSVHEVDPGPREVIVSAPGYRDYRWSGELRDGDDVALDVVLARDAPRAARGTPAWLLFTTGGAAVASTAVGAYFGLRATAASRDEKAKNQYARDPATKDVISAQSTVANVLFISGAVLGAGAVVLAFTTSWRRAPAKADPGLVVGLVGPLPSLAAAGRF